MNVVLENPALIICNRGFLTVTRCSSWKAGFRSRSPRCWSASSCAVFLYRGVHGGNCDARYLIKSRCPIARLIDTISTYRKTAVSGGGNTAVLSLCFAKSEISGKCQLLLSRFGPGVLHLFLAAVVCTVVKRGFLKRTAPAQELTGVIKKIPR